MITIEFPPVRLHKEDKEGIGSRLRTLPRGGFEEVNGVFHRLLPSRGELLGLLAVPVSRATVNAASVARQANIPRAREHL
jgi:hypothetical protein